MAGGFQDMKGQLKAKRKRETGMEKERQQGKQRNRKEEEALSFLLSISAQPDEGPLGHQWSWAERRSQSLPSPWLFPLQASAEQADSPHPRTLPWS